VQEGAALARAVLDRFAGQSRLTLATSHHAEIKAAADEDKRWAATIELVPFPRFTTTFHCGRCIAAFKFSVYLNHTLPGFVHPS
jgi:hypothetical protein